jgi:hypothetical protein
MDLASSTDCTSPARPVTKRSVTVEPILPMGAAGAFGVSIRPLAISVHPELLRGARVAAV